MANEITLTTNINAINGLVRTTRQLGNISIDQIAQGKVEAVQAISMIASPLDLATLSNTGICLMRKIDDTDTIEVGVVLSSAGSFIPFISLKPGESFAGRLATSAPYAKASANTPLLDYTIMEA